MVIAVDVSVMLVLEARLPEREPRESRVTVGTASIISRLGTRGTGMGRAVS